MERWPQPSFPTGLHQDAAETIQNYFSRVPQTDTILVVNSCARGQAVPESDLDFTILTIPGIPEQAIRELEAEWQAFANAHPAILKYKRSGPFAHLHLDIITGQYRPSPIRSGEPIDFFEVEIGNQVRYSAPMARPGAHFRDLQKQWLPYYPETLRQERLSHSIAACHYDLDHIPFFIRRELYFQAFDILQKAFQEYLQALFISRRTYPIAYNKWIRYQIVELLQLPELYPELPSVLSVENIESNDLNIKAEMLRNLLNRLK